MKVKKYTFNVNTCLLVYDVTNKLKKCRNFDT